jgi:phage repressor protein C with HTH and peptisase S24 domain
MRGTFGATPEIDMPAGKRARFVPLLSWAQAGALEAGFTDEAYDYSGTISVDLNDRKAFGITIRGDSMVPEIQEGDDVIVSPSSAPSNGEMVIARTIHGDVMCKLYQTREGGTKVVLSSYNPAYPPIELSRDEIAWVYPVRGAHRKYPR